MPGGLSELFQLGNVLLERYEAFGFAEGGFAVVGFVRDLESAEPMAVKLPKPAPSGSRAEIADFASEVRFWLDLDPHRNIVTARFLRSIEDHPALFMDYVSGGSLRHRLRAGPLAEEEAVLFAHQLVQAMVFANRNGEVAHLDLKPENILLDTNLLKVSDFGLAQRVRVVNGSYTRPDSATWRYASPELFAGGVGDTRADIYTFGLILHEMITGRVPLPFALPRDPDESFERLDAFHRNAGMRDVAKELYYSGIPGSSSRDLSLIIAACIAHHPSERPGNFRLVQEMLETAFNLQATDDHVEALSNLQLFERALALRNMGLYSQSLTRFNQLLIREQGVPQYWREAAIALDAVGDHATARDFLKRGQAPADQRQ